MSIFKSSIFNFFEYYCAMKWILGACIFLVSYPLTAQQIGWEKVIGSEVASYIPNDLVINPDGTMILVGRYETGTGFFRTVDGVTKYADSTLPFGTHPFVQKLDKDGNLLKQVFLPGIEAQHVVQMDDNRWAVCGFMNGYREKNYEGDRAQGIFLVFLDSNLNRLSYTHYPSYYNSTPLGMIADQQGGLIIAADSYTKSDHELGFNDIYSLRLVHTDPKGKLITDTTFQKTDWFRKNKFRNDVFNPTSIATDSKYIWLSGTAKGTDSMYTERTLPAIAALDFDYRPGTTAVFTGPRKKAQSYEVWLSDLVASEKYVFVSGEDMLQQPNTFVSLFDSNGKQIYQLPCKGNIGESPFVTQLDETNWAVLTKSREFGFVVSFFNTKGFVKELIFSQENSRDAKVLVCAGNELYCVGKISENDLKKTWISKVRIRP
ncbi:hypothetical protein D3C87_309050 [compost metagenome]